MIAWHWVRNTNARGWGFAVYADTRGEYDPIAGPYFIFASGRYWIRNSSGILNYPCSVVEVFRTKILRLSILIVPAKALAKRRKSYPAARRNLRQLARKICIIMRWLDSIRTWTGAGDPLIANISLQR
jgi:hypothetical protein